MPADIIELDARTVGDLKKYLEIDLLSDRLNNDTRDREEVLDMIHALKDATGHADQKAATLEQLQDYINDHKNKPVEYWMQQICGTCKTHCENDDRPCEDPDLFSPHDITNITKVERTLTGRSHSMTGVQFWIDHAPTVKVEFKKGYLPNITVLHDGEVLRRQFGSLDWTMQVVEYWAQLYFEFLDN